MWRGKEEGPESEVNCRAFAPISWAMVPHPCSHQLATEATGRHTY